MYLRADHAELHLPTLRHLIRSHPLGVLTTAIPSASSSFPLLQSTHIPFLLDIADESSETELGTLRGHMARANPHSKALIEAAVTQCNASQPSRSETAPTGGPTKLATEVMILFTSPVDHYITPKFYTTTKPSTGKVVPTWNYAAVQVYGTLKLYHDKADPSTTDFLSQQVSDLSRYGEEAIMAYQEPWTVQQAPEKYVDLLKKAIVGVEIKVDRMVGKWKMSQEMGDGDREGVIEGLNTKVRGEVGLEMAKMVKERDGLKKARQEEAKTGSAAADS